MNNEVTQTLANNGITPTGVLMVGAHFAQEYTYYKSTFGINEFVFFEPNPTTFQILTGIVQTLQNENAELKFALAQTALGSDPNKKFTEFYVETANAGASCSVLKPKKHLEYYPGIQFPHKVVVQHTTLDEYMATRLPQTLIPERLNFIQLDVQGFELEVLKGGVKHVSQHTEAILTEINRAELYDKCAQLDDLDQFLLPLGFERAWTHWVEADWGDALYVRKQTN